MVAAGGGERPLLEEKVLEDGSRANTAVGVQKLVCDTDGPRALLQVERRQACRVVLRAKGDLLGDSRQGLKVRCIAIDRRAGLSYGYRGLLVRGP
jgi:hypothetical protein